MTERASLVLKSIPVVYEQELRTESAVSHGSINRTARGAVVAVVLLTASACAEFSEWMSFDPEHAEAARQAEASQLWEMTLMAGRYGAMLGQAREILNLPEPKLPTGGGFPTGDLDPAKSRAALAAYQVTVAVEFAGDVARACKRGRLPKKVPTHACAQENKLPAEFRTPATAEMPALAARNDRVGDFILPWWSEVCDSAPKPKDGTPACPME